MHTSQNQASDGSLESRDQELFADVSSLERGPWTASQSSLPRNSTRIETSTALSPRGVRHVGRGISPLMCPKVTHDGSTESFDQEVSNDVLILEVWITCLALDLSDPFVILSYHFFYDGFWCRTGDEGT